MDHNTECNDVVEIWLYIWLNFKNHLGTGKLDNTEDKKMNFCVDTSGDFLSVVHSVVQCVLHENMGRRSNCA